MNRVMIAGTNSNVGKTTVSMGIMAALRKRGLNVAPFKVGPDYIDPGFHKFVTGNPSYNLDSYLLDENSVKYLINNNNNTGADIGIIEGVMGFYDAFGLVDPRGSSAHVSIVTKTPVILVIDGSGIANSAAAVVLGYKMMDENTDIRGVIVNKVSGEYHYNIIKSAVERVTGIKCIGYMPKDPDSALSSRHLGLIPADEIKDLRNRIERLIERIEECIDLDELLKISASAPKIEADTRTIDDFIQREKKHFTGRKIGIAMDKAFSFYYQSNIDLLKALGAELVEFSPISDKYLPEGLDSIYLGGGFPEVFSKELEKNAAFRDSLSNYLENGGKCFAECGGYIYLSEKITSLKGVTENLTGFLPFSVEMTKSLQNFGYVEIEIELDGHNVKTKGHEFHHSKIIRGREQLSCIYHVKKYKDDVLYKKWMCGVRKNNVIAGYAHVMFLSNPEIVKNLL